MERILDLARRLGKQIAEHPRGQAYRRAKQELARDREAQELLKEFSTQADKIRGLESAGKPVEPEDKRQLVAIQERIAGNECLSGHARAQADFVELMQQVSDAIDRPE